jgi:hypothetical protein
MVLRPDTRTVGHFALTGEAVTEMVERFRAAYPNEAALCLSGFVRDTLVEGNRWIVAQVTGVTVARSDSADQFHVFFPRVPRTGCADPIIAIAHDHIFTPPSEACTHSLPDALVLFNETRALVSVVFCGDGRSEAMFQDGRRVASRWVPEP